jgi:hypothetical protein
MAGMTKRIEAQLRSLKSSSINPAEFRAPARALAPLAALYPPCGLDFARDASARARSVARALGADRAAQVQHQLVQGPFVQPSQSLLTLAALILLKQSSSACLTMASVLGLSIKVASSNASEIRSFNAVVIIGKSLMPLLHGTATS